VRQVNFRFQAPHRAVVKSDVAAMQARDIPRNGKAEARTAFVLVAGFIQPDERFEDFFSLGGGDTGAIILHRDNKVPALLMSTRLDLFAVAESIRHQIANQACHTVGARTDGEFLRAMDLVFAVLELGLVPEP